MVRDFVKSFANFSWGLSVLGVSQAVNLLRGLPTSDPTLRATKTFEATTDAMRRQYDAIDDNAYKTGRTVNNVLIDLFFDFFQPNTFRPTTIAETTQNVVKAVLGVGAQLIPGGKVWTGGPPQGWGPVNNQDAELFYVPPASFAAEAEVQQYEAAAVDHRDRPTGGYEHVA
jgi:hypothetical protein